MLLTLKKSFFFQKKSSSEVPSQSGKNLTSVRFGDERLQKLWEAAQEAKFAKEELQGSFTSSKRKSFHVSESHREGSKIIFVG